MIWLWVDGRRWRRMARAGERGSLQLEEKPSPTLVASLHCAALHCPALPGPAARRRANHAHFASRPTRRARKVLLCTILHLNLSRAASSLIPARPARLAAISANPRCLCQALFGGSDGRLSDSRSAKYDL